MCVDKLLKQYPDINKKLLLLAINRFEKEREALKNAFLNLSHPENWKINLTFYLPLLGISHRDYSFSLIQFTSNEYPYEIAVLEPLELINYYCIYEEIEREKAIKI